MSHRFVGWMSPDWSAAPQPVPYANLNNPKSLNLYSYVGNNPIATADADGHCCSDWADAIDAHIDKAVNALVAYDVASGDPDRAANAAFYAGTLGDIGKGFSNLLRLGNDIGNVGDDLSQGDYLSATNDIAQDGARLVGIGALATGAFRSGLAEDPAPIEPYDRAEHYGNPSTSAAAQEIRQAGEGQPCPTCSQTMKSGTKTAPTAEHQPSLKSHYYNKGHKMTAAQRPSYARSPKSMKGPKCKRCQSKQGADESKTEY